MSNNVTLEETTKDETVREWFKLDTRDRCDRCQAQAYVVVLSNDSGREVLLCGHHFKNNQASLEAWGTVVLDERDRLTRRSDEVHA